MLQLNEHRAQIVIIFLEAHLLEQAEHLVHLVSEVLVFYLVHELLYIQVFLRLLLLAFHLLAEPLELSERGLSNQLAQLVVINEVIQEPVVRIPLAGLVFCGNLPRDKNCAVPHAVQRVFRGLCVQDHSIILLVREVRLVRVF